MLQLDSLQIECLELSNLLPLLAPAPAANKLLWLTYLSKRVMLHTVLSRWLPGLYQVRHIAHYLLLAQLAKLAACL